MEIKPYMRKTHYYETDQMGIIHHSNYIRWFEEARVDFMDQAGFGYDQMEAEGISSPVLGVNCDYKSMVRFNDTILIYVRVDNLTGTKMTISYKVTDAQTGAVRATGESRHCFLNSDGRPVSLKKENPRVYALFLEYATQDTL